MTALNRIFVGKMPFGTGIDVRFTECQLYKCPPYTIEDLLCEFDLKVFRSKGKCPS